MSSSHTENDKWDLSTGEAFATASEVSYQRYLIALHYRALEYQHYAARFLPKRMARVHWFGPDVPQA